ncbi:D-arabinono-1,4-lactone oxidase [Tersicoccus sp. MR15.9]|uniref:D-arabinono-1,4-lactone oxidase n=1 Tax=Tersicoccus mangrovi TaxID=3121635 RepID=UPI002FE562B6
MQRWHNWGRTEAVEGIRVVRPDDTDELASLLADGSAQHVRPLGSGHSFSGIGAPEEVALDVGAFSGLLAVDRERRRVTLGAGTHLWEIPGLLSGHRLAMQNLGDIDRQTLAGALSTGTHGTGAAFGGLSTQVVGVTLVTGDGRVLTVDEDTQPELLPFVRLGLGALGVLTEVTLQCVPAFSLRAEEATRDLASLNTDWDGWFDGADHAEFHWFPGTGRVVTKTNTRLPGDSALAPRSRIGRWVGEELLANAVFGGLCAVSRHLPRTVPVINRVATAAMGRGTFTEPSPRVFAAPRRVRFREMEYAVPREQMQEAFGRIRRLADGWPEPVEFPVEVRVAAADDVALSPGHGRDIGYIAVHRHLRRDHTAYFAAAERIFADHDGRPHWGKLHRLDADDLAALYPRFEEFLAVRDRLDPARRLTNPYLRRVLGS